MSGLTVDDCGSPQYLDGIKSQFTIHAENRRPVAYCFTKEEAEMLAAAPDLAKESQRLRWALEALVLNIDAGGATLGAMKDAREALSLGKGEGL